MCSISSTSGTVVTAWLTPSRWATCSGAWVWTPRWPRSRAWAEPLSQVRTGTVCRHDVAFSRWKNHSHWLVRDSFLSVCPSNPSNIQWDLIPPYSIKYPDPQVPSNFIPFHPILRIYSSFFISFNQIQSNIKWHSVPPHSIQYPVPHGSMKHPVPSSSVSLFIPNLPPSYFIRFKFHPFYSSYTISLSTHPSFPPSAQCQIIISNMRDLFTVFFVNFLHNAQ